MLGLPWWVFHCLTSDYMQSLVRALGLMPSGRIAGSRGVGCGALRARSDTIQPSARQGSVQSGWMPPPRLEASNQRLMAAGKGQR